MSEGKKKISNDLLKGRMKSSNFKSSKQPEGLSSIWADQKRIEKEEKQLQEKYRRAKKEARQLRKQVIKNSFNDEITSIKYFSGRHFEKISKKQPNNFNSKYIKVGVGVFAVLVVGIVIFNVTGNKNSTGTLGDSVSDNSNTFELPREKADFSMLYPTGRTEADYEVVRISPPESAPSYTYLDRFTDDGQIFRVTQQELPENFDLAKTATDFQATSIIQIDDNVVYHGYSEKGGVQSLLFVKDNKFISIRSPQKFPDDTWAGYILSLK